MGLLRDIADLASAARKGFTSSLHTVFTRAGGVHMENSDVVDQPMLQLAAFAKVVRAITRNVAQVPFQVGRWEKAKTGSQLRDHWRHGYGAGFKAMRPLDAQRKQAQGQVWAPVSDHPLQQLFDRPNPFLSRYSLWEGVSMWLCHEGEAFFHWIGREKPGDIPAGIELFTPTSMKLMPERQKPEYWEFSGTADGVSRRFEFSQITQTKYYNPYNPFRGLSPRQACGIEIHSIWDSKRFNRAILKNGGWPGGILSTKHPLTSEQKEQMKQSFEERHGGASKAGRILTLSGEADFKQIQWNHRAMQFLELVENAQQDIQGVYKVPDAEISEYENMSYASGSEGKRSFWEATILPDLRLIEDDLWANPFSDIDGGRFEGRFDVSGIACLQEQIAPKLDQAGKLFALGYPPNMINERLNMGLPMTQHGEVGWMPSGLNPINLTAAQSALNGAQITAAVTVLMQLTAGGMGRVAAIELLASLGIDKGTATQMVADTLKNVKAEPVAEGKSIATADVLAPEMAAKYWNEWIARTFEPSEKAFDKKWGRFLMDLRSHQLKRLEEIAGNGKGKAILDAQFARALSIAKRVEGLEGADALKSSATSFLTAPSNGDNWTAFSLALRCAYAQDESVRVLVEKEDLPPGLTLDDVEAILFDRKTWGEELGGKMAPVYETTIETAITERIGELNLTDSSFFSAKDPTVKAFLEKKLFKLKEGPLSTIAKELKASLVEGVQNGEAVRDLAVRIREIFNASSGRSLMVARTETLQAVGWSQFETDKRSGVVTGKLWLTSQDEHVRGSHLDFQALGYKEMEYEYATNLKFPGDGNGPVGELVNCRCVHVPALEGEKVNDSIDRILRWMHRR